MTVDKVLDNWPLNITCWPFLIHPGEQAFGASRPRAKPSLMQRGPSACQHAKPSLSVSGWCKKMCAALILFWCTRSASLWMSRGNKPTSAMALWCFVSACAWTDLLWMSGVQGFRWTPVCRYVTFRHRFKSSEPDMDLFRGKNQRATFCDMRSRSNIY